MQDSTLLPPESRETGWRVRRQWVQHAESSTDGKEGIETMGKPIEPLLERLLELLEAEGLVTANQRERLHTAIERGMSPQEAVVKVPMVEPLRLATLLARAGQELRDTAPPAPETTELTDDEIDELVRANAANKAALPTFAPPDLDDDDAPVLEIDPNALPSSVSLGNGESFDLINLGPATEFAEKTTDPFAGIPVVELDLGLDDGPTAEVDLVVESPVVPTTPPLLDNDIDLDLDIDLHHPPAAGAADLDPDLDLSAPADVDPEISDVLDEVFSASCDEVPPPPPEQRVSRSSDMVDIKGLQARPVVESTSAVPRTLQPPGEPGEYPVRGTMNTFDLANDEGIGLIARVNQLFAHVIEISGQGFVLDRSRPDNNYCIYNGQWQLEEQRTVEDKELEKMINRIRAMGKLESWKRHSPQRGQFMLRHAGEDWRVLVESNPSRDGRDVLTVYLLAD